MAVTTLNVTLCIKVWTKKFKKTSGQWQLTKSRRAFITAGIINGNLKQSHCFCSDQFKRMLHN